MPIIPNTSESDRLRRLQGRVIFTDYLVQKQAFEQGVINNISGANSVSGSLSLTNRVEASMYMTPAEIETINKASYFRPPEPPTDITVKENSLSQVLLAWDSPITNTPITSYTIISDPPTQTFTSIEPTVMFTGLSSGTKYTFSVSATNQYGTSKFCLSDLILSGSVPSAPSGITGLPGSGQVDLTWQIPENNGSEITSYTIVSNPATTSRTSTTNSYTFTGLTNGISYTFNITAINSFGKSESGSSSFTPASVPPAPSGITGLPGSGQVDLTWQIPENNGSEITSYTIVSNPATTSRTSTTNSYTFTGLTNGISYTFNITAINGAGPSIPGSSSSFTPN